MAIELKRHFEKRVQIAQAMHSIVSDAEEADRGLTDEERSKCDGYREEINALDARIADIRAANELDDYVDFMHEPENPKPKENRSYGDNDGVPPGINPPVKKDPAEDTDEARYAAAFDRLMRSTEPGMTGLTDEDRGLLRANFVTESRGPGTGSGPAGGYLVPTTMGNRIIETMQAFGGIRRAATVMQTSSGEDILWPTNDDTAQKAVIVGESQDVGETDITFGQVKIGAFKYSTKVLRVPFELLQDSAFRLDSFISRKFGQRLGRGTAAHYATGAGTTEPTGLTVAASVGHTAASGTEVVYKDLLRTKHSVDPAYRQRASWVFSDSLLLGLKEMEDSQGRPLWKPAIATDAPDLIDGDPFIIDQGVPAPEAGAIAAAYGDLTEYVIRDVRGIMMMRLYEKFAEYGQVGYLAFFRTDGNLMDTSAVKTLKMAGAATRSKAA